MHLYKLWLSNTERWGVNMRQINTQIIVDKILNSEKKKLFYLWVYQNNIEEATKIINEYANGEKYNIEDVFHQFEIAYSKEPDVIKANQEAAELLKKPQCPTCQSTDVHKMSGIETGASVAVLGVFSRKINKTFKCKHCGYMW